MCHDGSSDIGYQAKGYHDGGIFAGFGRVNSVVFSGELKLFPLRDTANAVRSNGMMRVKA
jgi:hypothetical protein